MARLRANLAVRLAIGYGALIVVTMVAIGGVVYLGTVGVIERGINTKLGAASGFLLAEYRANGIEGLERQVVKLLTDKIDQDTEVYLLTGPNGKIVGNIGVISNLPTDKMTDRDVMRYGRPSFSRVLTSRLPGGYTLTVGRDLTDLAAIRQLVLRSMILGGIIALLLAMGGALLFRRQLEARIGAIRRTAEAIEGGNLNERIPEETGLDEFTKLNHSINHMLDRIQRLMDGVRDVSNAIAHDLRTPLGRIRALLDEAVSAPAPATIMADRARAAIAGIDELTSIFDKLLQIAEAESGASRPAFRPLSLGDIVLTVTELYDATAEAKGITLGVDASPLAMALGDKDLLASATANLVDNALKYAAPGATVAVSARADRDTVSIVVQDNGPGVSDGERAKIVTRFYRVDQSRSLPGNGLGLTIVNAIAELHRGSLLLEDANPGLRACIVMPRLDPALRPSPNANPAIVA